MGRFSNLILQLTILDSRLERPVGKTSASYLWSTHDWNILDALTLSQLLAKRGVTIYYMCFDDFMTIYDNIQLSVVALCRND